MHDNKNSESAPAYNYYFLDPATNMGRAILQVDWSENILGPPKNWSLSLRNTVGLLLGSKFPMILWWGEELIQFYNDACVPMLEGIGKIPQVGRRADEIWSNSWHLTGPVIRKVMQSGEAVYFKDQQIPFMEDEMNMEADRFYCFSYSPVFGDTGQIEGVLGICANTGAAEPAAPEKSFESLVQQAEIGIIVLEGADNIVSFVNNAYLGLVDRSYEQLNGKPLFEVIPESGQDYKSIIDNVRSSGDPCYLNEHYYSTVGQDGTQRSGFMNLVYQPFEISGSGDRGVMVLCTEVTELVLSQKKLKKSEQQIRSLVAGAPFPIGVYEGPEMRITLANESIIDVWGKGSDTVGKTYFEVLPELESQDIYPRLLEVFSKGKPYHARNQRVELKVRGNLQPFYFNYSFTPLFDESGRVYGVMNTAADVTDLYLSKIKLEKTQQEFKNLILQAPVCMCLLMGPSHTVEIANACMIDLWGKQQADVMNKPIFEALPDAREQGLEELLDHVFKTGETFTASEMPVHLIRFGNPDIVYQNFIYEPYRDAGGEILGVIAISNDVTRQVLAMRKIEETVQQRTQELESANEHLSRSNAELAQFAYIASHDLQEPLRKISIFSQMLESKAGASLDVKSQGQLKKIRESSERMQALVQDVLAYSQLNSTAGEFVPVDLNEIVGGILSDMELLIEQKGASIHVEELPVVPGQPLQLTQLLGNLIGNSLKFHRADSPPFISVAAFEVPDGEKQELALDPAATYVNIVVSDRGIGFKEEDAEKIFELFQRLHNKSEFEGTGIGLSICMKIAQNHNGVITAKGSSEKGARFNIYLPLA